MNLTLPFFRSRESRKRRFYARPAAFLILLPFIVLVSIPLLVRSYVETVQSAMLRSGLIRPTESPHWQESRDSILAAIGTPDRTYAHYKVRNWETLATISERYGIDETHLRALNPGEVLPGLTIRIPALEKPLAMRETTALAPTDIEINQEAGQTIVQTPLRYWITVDLPQLKNIINDTSILEEVAPRHWRIKAPLTIDNNIRLQINRDTAELIELVSGGTQPSCLCIENGQLVMDGITVRSFDPATNDIDRTAADGRGYIRARRNSRMDITNSDISYLGYGSSPRPSGGGTYGVSWRIPNNSLGAEMVTGWVENSKFHHNYFGTYTFGSFGMTYRGNEYYENEVYGLDPHDDSNGGLIENNVFHHNGLHGFIVSKRCNNNVIRNNHSYSNKGHGFMLHQDSHFNVLEDNYAHENLDNIALYSSNYSVIRNNRLESPRRSNIRLNEKSRHSLIVGNRISGGKGIKIYGESSGNLILKNYIHTKDPSVDIDKSSVDNVLAENTIVDRDGFLFEDFRTVVVGPNSFTE